MAIILYHDETSTENFKIFSLDSVKTLTEKWLNTINIYIFILFLKTITKPYYNFLQIRFCITGSSAKVVQTDLLWAGMYRWNGPHNCWDRFRFYCPVYCSAYQYTFPNKFHWIRESADNVNGLSFEKFQLQNVKTYRLWLRFLLVH